MGKVFKKMRKLRISPEGVQWERRLLPLGEITRLRWGGTRHEMAFTEVKTYERYSIFIGTGPAGTEQRTVSQQDGISIEFWDWKHQPPANQVYSEFVDHLWRAVGVRLLIEMLQGLRDGKKYDFSGISVDDCGVEFDRRHRFSPDERIRWSWHETRTYNDIGSFCIEPLKNSKTLDVRRWLIGIDADELALKYEYIDNVHVLAAAIKSLNSQHDAYNALLSIANDPNEPASRRASAVKICDRVYVSRKTKGLRLSHSLDLLFPDYA